MQRRHKLRPLLTSTVLIAALGVTALGVTAIGGCFHQDGSNADPDPNDNTNPDTHVLNKAEDYYHLKANTGQAFDESLRAYLAAALSNDNYYRDLPFDEGIPTSFQTGVQTGAPTGATGNAAAPNSDTNASTTPNVSQTNVIEQGVDESDLMKSDGEYLFVVDNNQSHAIYDINTTGGVASVMNTRSTAPQYDTPQQHPRINIYALETTTPAAQRLKGLEMSADTQYIKGIYLTGDSGAGTRQLIVIADVSKSVDGQYLTRSRITAYDVSTIDTATKSWQLEIEGRSIGSRIVNGKLLFLTRKFFDIKPLLGLEVAPQTSTEIDSAVARISAQDILPYSWLNEVQTSLVSAADCVVPQETNEQSYFDFSITSIMTIPLDTPDAAESICTLESTSEIYVSPTALYLTKNDYLSNNGQGTLIHKFAINDTGLSYRASGRVPGTVGWRNTKFRMSEYEDHFRIVTSQYDDDKTSGAPIFRNGNTTHHLFILKEDKTKVGQLALVSQLPNSDHPEAIGKPGEQIYGVRFFGRFGYVVTFKKVDPLYVLNLSDPENPLIDGELVLPGYSDYLHPVNDSLLIGIGKDAIEENGTAWYQGIKVGIFDVSDKKNPAVVQEALIGKRGTNSVALSDHHAFTYIHNAGDDTVRFAFPVNVHDGAPANTSGAKASEYYDWQYSGLQLFELSQVTGEIQLNNARVIKNAVSTGEGSYYNFSASPRALFVNDAVFFSDVGTLWAADWNDPDSVESSLEVVSVSGYITIDAIGDPASSSGQPIYALSIIDAGTNEKIHINNSAKVNDFMNNNNTFNRLVTIEGKFATANTAYQGRQIDVTDIRFSE